MLKVQSLGQIAYQVQDVQKSTEFFRDVVGLPFLFSAGPNLAFFDLNGCRLMVTRDGSQQETRNSILYFLVNSINEAYEALDGQVKRVDEPHLIAEMADHDLYMFFIEDGQGNTVGFMEERPK